MKWLMIIVLFLLAGCAADIRMTVLDLNGAARCEVTAKTMRRIAMSMRDCTEATVISGQILIDDATVQALSRDAAQVVDPL